MKKSAEIWIITGIGLLGLWAMYKGRSKSNFDCNELSETPKTTPKDKTAYVTESQDIANKVDGASVWANYMERPFVHTNKWLQRPKRNPFRPLKNKNTYQTTQLTLTNTSDVEREVTLWGGNRKPPISPLLPGEITDHTFTIISLENNQDSGRYPQGMVVNPYNGYLYIANQLSNTITVLQADGTLVRHIPVGGSRLFGASPVALAVNDKPNTTNFGKVYIANCIANTVSIIGRSLAIENDIVVGSRPVAIAFNSFNDTLIVSNLADDTVSVIDAQTEHIIETVAVGKSPTHLAIVPENGQAYVINSGDDSISILGHPSATLITNIGQGLRGIAYHTVNQTLYVVASAGEQVIPIGLDTLIVGAGIKVGADPYGILYNPKSTLLYVGNREDNTYAIIDSDNQVKETLALGTVNNSFVLDNITDTLYSNDPLGGKVTQITYLQDSNAVTINEGYEAKREDFTFNPAIIKHVKFVLSGNDRFKSLKLEKQSINGSAETQSIAFSNYHNPQNYSNVAEVFEMAGTPIDGKHSWRFKIGVKQTITILTYYKQIEVNQLLKKELQTLKTI